MKKLTDQTPVEWRVSDGLTPYETALDAMKRRAGEIADGVAGELIWLVEHPALYTAGTSARPADLLEPDLLPVFTAGRGGQYTYHGPGQRVIYVMLDLTRRGRDVRAFVNSLEAWIIDTLACYQIEGKTHCERIGVWVDRPQSLTGEEDKIAAIGIRLSRWVSFHGISLNVNPDLSHYAGIVPCGISGHGVTSLAQLGVDVPMAAVDEILFSTFGPIFGPAETI